MMPPLNPSAMVPQAALPAATAPRPLVAFRLGAQLFALDAMHVRGALRDMEVTPVPLAADTVAGIAWYGGKPVSVVDLRPYLELPKRHGTPSVLIMAHEDELVALLVDKIEDVISIAPNEFSPAPVTMDPAWRQVTASMIEHPRGLIAVLDIPRTLRTLSPALTA